MTNGDKMIEGLKGLKGLSMHELVNLVESECEEIINNANDFESGYDLIEEYRDYEDCGDNSYGYPLGIDSLSSREFVEFENMGDIQRFAGDKVTDIIHCTTKIRNIQFIMQYKMLLILRDKHKEFDNGSLFFKGEIAELELALKQMDVVIKREKRK